ncbi:hypothetical protein B0H14DRAFT_3492531 [Mycena olivaceomarginata]|nr:hypothetical protein B0H14DRAFT_3492531 [Mycena olivaceomarginata]
MSGLRFRPTKISRNEAAPFDICRPSTPYSIRAVLIDTASSSAPSRPSSAPYFTPLTLNVDEQDLPRSMSDRARTPQIESTVLHWPSHLAFDPGFRVEDAATKAVSLLVVHSGADGGAGNVVRRPCLRVSPTNEESDRCIHGAATPVPAAEAMEMDIDALTRTALGRWPGRGLSEGAGTTAAAGETNRVDAPIQDAPPYRRRESTARTPASVPPLNLMTSSPPPPPRSRLRSMTSPTRTVRVSPNEYLHSLRKRPPTLDSRFHVGKPQSTSACGRDTEPASAFTTVPPLRMPPPARRVWLPHGQSRRREDDGALLWGGAYAAAQRGEIYGTFPTQEWCGLNLVTPVMHPASACGRPSSMGTPCRRWRTSRGRGTWKEKKQK